MHAGDKNSNCMTHDEHLNDPPTGMDGYLSYLVSAPNFQFPYKEMLVKSSNTMVLSSACVAYFCSGDGLHLGFNKVYT